MRGMAVRAMPRSMVLSVLSDPSVSLSREGKDSEYSEKIFHGYFPFLDFRLTL